MESQELIRLTRDAGEEAYVRPEWVDRWVANGWKQAGTEHEDDGLDALDADALRALAKERGVDVHHKAGADKVREAIREAEKE